MTNEEEVKMFGLTIEEMRQNYLMWNIEGDALSMQMWAMGMLSDIQERISLGVSEDEETRQALNRAKYWMSEVSRIIRR